MKKDDFIKINYENIAYQKIKSNTYIVTLSDHKIHQLDDIATHIWELICRKKSVNEIVEILHNEYDVDKDTLLKDINEFLHELKQKNIIL
jgi:hypothetical protein